MLSTHRAPHLWAHTAGALGLSFLKFVCCVSVVHDVVMTRESTFTTCHKCLITVRSYTASLQTEQFSSAARQMLSQCQNSWASLHVYLSEDTPSFVVLGSFMNLT